jgi:hypothetical protein
MNFSMKTLTKISLLAFLLLINFCVNAQTMTDGIFMSKGSLCGSAIYTNDSWKNFWEGTLYRENKNVGTLTTESINLMVNYGFSDKFNVIAGLPYIATKASAGTSHGFEGVQDLSLGLKYRFIQAKNLSVIGFAGGSVPTNNYVADYMPFAIGFQSKNVFARGILYYTLPSGLAITLNGSYTHRANVTIDREMYYAGDKAIFSNQVALPDIVNIGAKFGHYSFRWQLEATLDQQTMGQTVGGTVDIRRNDGPFFGSQFNATRLGIFGAYRIPKLKDLQVIGSMNKVIAGRNVGESIAFSVGVSQFIDFFKNKPKGVPSGPICRPGDAKHEMTETKEKKQ